MQQIPDIQLLQQNLRQVQNLTFLKQGGFKAVYKGTIESNLEAIKVVYIPADLDNEGVRDEIVGRVLREIESLRKCACDFIVQLGSLPPELIRISQQEYIVYSEEFLDGQSLRERLQEGHRPNYNELQALTISFLEAIRVLKNNDLIHRDIKPDNVMALQDSARPFVILDLGIAFKLHGTELTRDSRYHPGTLPYMAPEMFIPRFRETLDYRSDLYSAGITLYEYAAGKHPITRRCDDDYTTMYRILRTTPIALSDNRSDLPKDFCRMVDQLIKKLPALRPSSIDMLLKKLKERS